MHAPQNHEQRGAQRSAVRSADRLAGASTRSAGRDTTGILALQRRIGNAAVNQLLAQEEPERARPAGPAAAVPVQRNVQDHLTDARWRPVAAGKPAVPAPRKASEGRAGDQVLGRVGPALLKRLHDMTAGRSPEQLEQMGRLELFRAMPAVEAADIVAWWGGPGAVPAAKLMSMEHWIRTHQDRPGAEREFNKTFGETKRTARPGREPRDGVLPVINHLGDEEQARTYLSTEEGNVLMKFVLKPGAHELLFHPDHMAVIGESQGRTPQFLRDIHGGMPQAKKGEGKLDGYIGIKQEKPRVYKPDGQGRMVRTEGRGDFSLSLGQNKWSRLLFQLFVEDIQKV